MQDALESLKGMRRDRSPPYAVLELAGEHYPGVFSDLYGIRAIFLRYFNVFGPDEGPISISGRSHYIPRMRRFVYLPAVYAVELRGGPRRC